MSLDNLAHKIAAQDQAAFGELYEKLRRIVYSVCLGVVKNRGVAEELTQDTFVTVWQRSAEFRGKGYKTWVLTIARNKALNELKRRKRETLTDFSEAEKVATYTVDAQVENSVVLQLALNKLDETDRQIVLFRNAGMKAKEIAEFLDMPRGTVSWRYSEAIAILKKELGGET